MLLSHFVKVGSQMRLGTTDLKDHVAIALISSWEQRRLGTTDLKGHGAVALRSSWEPKALGNHRSEGSCCCRVGLKLAAHLEAKGAWEPLV